MRFKIIWDTKYGKCYKLLPDPKRTYINLGKHGKKYPTTWASNIYFKRFINGYRYKTGPFPKQWLDGWKRKRELINLLKRE